MEQGELFKRKNRPTMLQLKYLIELEKHESGRGIVALIAEKCGVNHGSVSRYFKTCHQSGYLTEDYKLTKMGAAWLEGYKSLIDDLTVYLGKIGISEKEIPENVKDMIENIDYYTLASMLRNDQRMKSIYSAKKKEILSRNFLEEVLGYGNRHVDFMLYRMEGRGGGVSMADRGFEKPAYLRHNKRVSWLELEIRDMKANSRVDGKEMIGHLESLKYEYGGILHKADMKVGKIRIPLPACHFHRRQGGEIQGTITVTVTCSVGRGHMPESTAMLLFWL